MNRWLLILCFALFTLPAQAAMDILATTASLGALTREIGGGEVKVTVMAPSDRDPHDLTAKPSLLRLARGADGLVSVGGLEEGWLPAVLEQAGNRAIQPGQPGSFVATRQVELKKETREANPLYGHVHKEGNPHVHMDPLRMATLARALGDWLAGLDAAHASDYRARAAQSAARLESAASSARTRLQGASGVVLYHEDAIYFLDCFGIPLLGTLEPFPGVPPSASHLQDLSTRLKGQRGIVIRTPYQPEDGARMLAGVLGWTVAVLPLEPAEDARLDGYLALIDRWVNALAPSP
ncbi:MAG: metal ABC transporter substrate-binding protein [Pseudomonadota bacterium]